MEAYEPKSKEDLNFDKPWNNEPSRKKGGRDLASRVFLLSVRVMMLHYNNELIIQGIDA